MASIGKEDASSRAAMTDLAINMADKLIDAFQKVADGSGDGACESPHTGLASYGNHSGDQGTENDNDGNETWHEMVEEDDGDADEAEEEEDGLERENIETLISPIGAHGFDAHLISQDSDEEGSDIIFTPARALQFDGSDGDDQPAVDQKYLPRRVFIQSDFTQGRPELHGSEEADCVAPGAGLGAYLVDQSQNVRIIEGHDDIDKGAAFISQRNTFLHTQLVQLPILIADDYLNQTANLYDSLERDDHFYPEDGDREHGSFKEGQDQNNRESVSGEGEMSGKTHQPDLGDENTEHQHAIGYTYGGQQFASRLLQATDVSEQEKMDNDDMTASSLTAKALSTCTVTMVEASQLDGQHQLHDEDDDEDDTNSVKDEDHDAQAFTAPFLVPVHGPAANSKAFGSDKTSLTGLEQNQVTGAITIRPGNAANIRSNRKSVVEVVAGRPRNQQAATHRTGVGPGAGGDSNSQQVCPRLSRAEQRLTAAGSSNVMHSRVGVGSYVRQPTNGAQRPAVQGSASAQTANHVLHVGDAAAVGGDGDGAGDGESSNSMPPPQIGVSIVGTSLQSRTSSQGSVQSATSGNSHSRVGGVGKESNSSHNTVPLSRPAMPRSADHKLGGSGVRQGLPPQNALPQTQLPQHSHPTMARSTTHLHPEPKLKSAGKSTASALDNRTLLLQKQKQLQQEQQQLLIQQKQLQQRIQQPPPGSVYPSDADQFIHHYPEMVATQLSKGITTSISVEMQGVEEVRNQLQSMLKNPKDSAPFDHQGFDYADLATDQLPDRHGSLHDVESSSLSGMKGFDEVSDMFDSFPSFSYKIFSDMSRGDASVHNENVYLRDCLEKERYRRKHCEQQIQNLNAKLLELQQQLVVAVSTDKRKDLMIDQLDKQLGKVVERWKRREAEKDEYMQMMMKEKLQIEETLQKQQTMIDSFEKDLARTVEELKQEKEKSSEVVDKMKEELSTAIHARKHAEDLLSAEKERVMLIEKDWEQLKESRDLAEKRAQQAQERLHQEQDSWYQREKELLNKIDQVKDANLKVMQMEHAKYEQQTKKMEELEENLHMAQADVKKLEMEVDCALREKESLRVEMAIAEAKFENAQRTLEADLQAQMEKEISEQLKEVHEKMRLEQEGTAEKHRRTVSELHQRHQRDLETQLVALRQDTSRKEEDLRLQLAEQENQLSEFRRENTALKQAKQKLESQRMEVLAKLQFIMQSQWNEAVSLLVSTPQRKNLNNPMASSVGSASFTSLLTSQTVPDTSSSQLHLGPAANLSASSFSSPQATSQNADKTEVRHGSTGTPHLASGSSRSSSRLHQTSHADDRENHVGSRAAVSCGGAIMTLEDIAGLLSRGGGDSSTMLTRNIHGVLHNSGLVVQSQVQESEVRQRQGHQAIPASLSSTHATMIRPPQQFSHSLLSTAEEVLTSFAEEQPQEDFSFISTRDIPSSHKDLPRRRQQNGCSGRRSKDVERSSNGDMVQKGKDLQLQAQHPSDVERSLALSDLDSSSSHSTLRNAWLSQNSIHCDHREEPAGSQAQPQDEDVFLLERRFECLSPPVKQSRDGERESESVLQESNRLNDSYREISRQLEEHQARQKELQHYIKMLLDKPPRMVNEKPERDNHVDPDSLETSRETADWELTEAAQAAQISTELHRLQQLRNRQVAEVVTQPMSPQTSQRRDRGERPGTAGSSARQAASLPPGSLQAQQLAELSYLLNHYQEGLEIQPGHPLTAAAASSASIAHILNFLASVQQQTEQVAADGRQSSSARTSPRCNHTQRTRDRHKAKKNGDSRHHSLGPETSLSTSNLSERNERSMASSVKSNSSRKVEKKSEKIPTAAPSVKPAVRPQGKDHPVWK